ncbi:MAG: ectonucleotide pyrophosphatase/phosphodiesterase [Pseudomonadota bacterium]
MKALLPLLGLIAASAVVPAGAAAAPVLLISVDGLRPGDVLDADRRGLKVPTLRRLAAEGAHASGVVGVLPTLTYPSHTTLITGVAPARHGVVNNLTFDPMGINQTGWYWYAADIKAPTLWDAAHKAGLKTLNVHWPVSVGAPVDANLAQIWRTGHDDDRKLLRALSTPGLVDLLERDGTPYPQGIDESVDADAARVAAAAKLIGDLKPGFTTVYLAGLDHIEHEHGPDTPEAKAALERIDTMLGRLVAAAVKADPATIVALVSDHGFAPVSTDVNLFGAFIQAGLITLDGGKMKSWDATPWFAGGSAAVVLARPDDAALKAKVAKLLADLRDNPATGIAGIIERPEIARRGGAPTADFWISFKPGFETGRDPTAPLAAPSASKGMHGYDPSLPEMRSTLLLWGKALPWKGDLGEIDMRTIAPTLAKLMGGELPSADVAGIKGR